MNAIHPTIKDSTRAFRTGELVFFLNHSYMISFTRKNTTNAKTKKDKYGSRGI
jgi:hypothetical protein